MKCATTRSEFNIFARGPCRARCCGRASRTTNSSHPWINRTWNSTSPSTGRRTYTGHPPENAGKAGGTGRLLAGGNGHNLRRQKPLALAVVNAASLSTGSPTRLPRIPTTTESTSRLCSHKGATPPRRISPTPSGIRKPGISWPSNRRSSRTSVTSPV
jgi:hypothetical protein